MCPVVSVVIPAFRCAQTISKAIDSALGQSVPLEIIVVNDCSPDQLDTVMEPYLKREEIVYVKNEINQGAAASRNVGVAMARGKYIAFLDSDDYWSPEKLSKQLAVMEARKVPLCCTGRELLTPDGKSTGRVIPVRQTITYRDMLKHNCINCSSVLIPTELAREFPMEYEESHEDYIMWLRLIRKYGDAAGINEPLLKYRTSTTGKSGNKLKSAVMTFRVYRHMEFGIGRSILSFISYMVHGTWKYFRSYWKI